MVQKRLAYKTLFTLIFFSLSQLKIESYFIRLILFLLYNTELKSCRTNVLCLVRRGRKYHTDQSNSILILLT